MDDLQRSLKYYYGKILQYQINKYTVDDGFFNSQISFMTDIAVEYNRNAEGKECAV